MSSLNDRLVASLRQLVLENLAYDRDDPDVVRALSVMTPSELLIRYLNWARRFIRPTPREVLRSNEFLANPIRQQRNADIDALNNDIRKGNDLTKYLSRRVRHGYVNSSHVEPHRRQDLDLMLNAWGIHHLHFSQELESDGFVKRGGSIIFAVFKPEKAYLIDIMNHGDWAREHVIRIIVTNWPNDGLVHLLKDILGSPRRIDDDERLELHNAQVNAPIEIDGKLYIPSIGMTLFGNSTITTWQASKILKAIKNFATLYEQSPECVRAQFTAAGISWPDEPDFAVELQPEKYGVVERKSGRFLRLGP